MTSFTTPSKQVMTARQLLLLAHDLQGERGAEYENKDKGERSFQKTATAFNAITGKDITPAEVALLLQILKDVRQWAIPDRLHEDSVVDGVNYSSLKGEELYRQFNCVK